MTLKEIISKIDRLNKELDKFRPLKPEQERRLVQKLRLDWNFHSSHIEGNTLTYGETKALLLWGLTAGGKPLRDVLEMKGHDEVVQSLFDIVQNKSEPITEVFIRNLHKKILGEPFGIDAETPDGKPTKKRVVPGEYKKQQNYVKAADGSLVEFASPEETPAKMKDLLDWYRKNEAKENPLILAATFHYKFIKIHPFDDGNGRMARILMNFILMSRDLPPAIIRTEKRQSYLQALAYADAGDLERFTGYVGEQVIASLELTIKAAKGETIEEPEDIDKKIAMLKKKMEGISDDIVVKESLDFPVFKRVFENSVKPLLIEVLKSFAKFDSIFRKIEFKYSIVIQGKNYQERYSLKNFYEDHIARFLEQCADIIDEAVIIKRIVINTRFEELTRATIKTFDTTATLEIKFFKNFYQIKTTTTIERKLPYHKFLTKEDISQIVNELANYVIQEADREIAKMNEKK